MKKIKLILICTVLILSSCVKELVNPISNEGRVSFQLKTKDAIEVETKSNTHENDINDIYLIVFDNTTDLFIECKAATKVNGNSYIAPLTPYAAAVKIIAVANIKSLLISKMSNWNSTTTYNNVFDDLLTNELKMNGGNIVSMPEIPPMSYTLMLDKIEMSMKIASPFIMERATAKITISVSTNDFTLLGANLYNAPTKGYIIKNQTPANLLAITRANYIGSENGAYNTKYMISEATQKNPIYCYETPIHTDRTKAPYVIINSNRGYYRINLTNKDGEQLDLQRNYYYKINITKVAADGALTPEEAEINPPFINTDIIIEDPTSHEIISNGVDYLGLTNSEFIIYDSYTLNEFNYNFESHYYGADYEVINGYDIATLTYKSSAGGEITCINCVTESGVGTIRFQNSAYGIWDEVTNIYNPVWNDIKDKLILPVSENTATSKKIIINIPHDFKSGKIKVKIGALEKEIIIQRHEIISYIGDIINMGTGFSTAEVNFETSFRPSNYQFFNQNYIPFVSKLNTQDMINFSSSHSGTYSKSLVLNNPSDNLYVKVNPTNGDVNTMFKDYPMYYSNASEFYLTRANQSRVRVHLIQEPLLDGITDAPKVGNDSENYCFAFWRNTESGERIIRVPSITDRNGIFWTARVIYGEEFIRITYTDDRTVGIGIDAETSGDPEDHKPNENWKTFLEQPFRKSWEKGYFPQFRIGLTGENPNPQKPRYGLVALMVPYSIGTGGQGQTFLIFVRQGEEPDYIFSTTDLYEGSPRTFAQAFSPFNLTVADTLNHIGGENYSDHKSMNGRGVFTKYPSQQGYFYQWGSDIAIHPTNPKYNIAINGYTYDYDASYKEVCPDGYRLPTNDEQNRAALHSFFDPTTKKINIGLCADGYYDRNKYSSAALTVGSGGEQGRTGNLYYNSKTLASIFIPQTDNRPIEKNYSSNNITWANIPTLTGNTQGVFYGSAYGDRPNPAVSDRKSAFPIRCVKITN